MIFNNSEDIKKDIKDKISNYLRESVGQNTSIDTNNIISLLRSYLYELQIRHEISFFGIDDDKKDYMINIRIHQSNVDWGGIYELRFKIDLFAELRKLKITKIQDHDNKNNLDNFFVIN